MYRFVDLPLAKKEMLQIKNITFIYSAIKENLTVVLLLVLSLVIQTFGKK
jgi:hypothetical protein